MKLWDITAIERRGRLTGQQVMNERNQAVVLMLLSALSFSLMQAVVKLSATSIGTMEQVFCRNLISMAISFVLRRSHLPLLGSRNHQPALLARSFFGFIGVVMLFSATAGARQADIAVLNRTSPIWVSLFALLILRERISKVQIPVILLCLAGAVAAMRPSFDSNTLPLVLALLTAVSSGLAYTMIAFCRGQVAPMTVIFHFSLFSTIAAGFLMIPSFVVPTPRDLIMLILIGIFGAGGQIGLTYAYQKAPAAEVSIYDYSGIIFSAILGYVLLGESLSLSTVVGAALITAGGLWSYCANRKQAAANR